ncbi:MAG: hypothetical protein ACRC5T_10685 [Cetobacterium sp.]
MKLNLFSMDIKSLKETIVEKLEKDYKEKELFKMVVSELYNEKFIGLRFNKEVINFLDVFDEEMMQRNGLKHPPFSRIITSVDVRTGKNNFDYNIDFNVENGIVSNFLEVDIDKKSFLFKTIEDMTVIFKEYLEEGDLKERMSDQTKELFSNSIDESYDIFNNFYEEYKEETFELKDIVSYIGFRQHGIEYYYIENRESDKVENNKE